MQFVLYGEKCHVNILNWIKNKLFIQKLSVEIHVKKYKIHGYSVKTAYGFLTNQLQQRLLL